MGYKVGLELMCKGRVRNVREVPIHFSARGQSKLTLTQQFRYLEHLSRLYDFYYPCVSPITKFLIATFAGWLVAFCAIHGNALCNQSADGGNRFISLCDCNDRCFPLPLCPRPAPRVHHRPPSTGRLSSDRSGGIGRSAPTALWMIHRLLPFRPLEFFVIPFAIATTVRDILRKELMQDVRGLRKDLRKEEWE